MRCIFSSDKAHFFRNSLSYS